LDQVYSESIGISRNRNIGAAPYNYNLISDFGFRISESNYELRITNYELDLP